MSEKTLYREWTSAKSKKRELTKKELLSIQSSFKDHVLTLKPKRCPGDCISGGRTIKCSEAAELLNITSRQVQRIAKAGFISKPYSRGGVIRGYIEWRTQWRKSRSVTSRLDRIRLRIQELRLERLLREYCN
jgi:hypothetical protein